MKLHALMFTLIMNAVFTYGQLALAPPAQELEPVENALTYHTPDYPDRIRQVLFTKAEPQNEFQFLSMPSFYPETLLTVRLKGDEYFGQALQPEKQIWYFKGDFANLKVFEKEKQLPKPLAVRAISLWQSMLLRTKYQRRNLSLDGISYAFLGSAPGYSKLSAESMNPEPGTKPDILAGIGKLLINYVYTDPDGEKMIENEMQELMSRLEKMLKDNTSNNRLQAIGAKARLQPEP